MNTKERIMEAALTLFSQRGYDAVSVGQIAETVGIKAPSLYNHFKSKQDILKAVMDEMNRRYDREVAARQMNGRIAGEDMTLFAQMSESQLLSTGLALFSYFLHDSYVQRFRKMLSIGQFENREMAELFSKQYVDDPLSYQGAMFGLMIQTGILKEEKPDIMALHFFAPIYFLLELCDRQPEREQEAQEMLKEHIYQFNRCYKREEA